MEPYVGGNACWSIGIKYYNDDVWTCDKKLQDLLIDYDFIYVYRGDHQFWDANMSLFNYAEIGKNKSLFKVDNNKQRLILINDGSNFDRNTFE
jgi:hypothetical protein